MLRRRDVLVGLGALSLVGCGRDGGAMSPVREPVVPPTPDAPAPAVPAARSSGGTVAPGVTRGPREMRVAFGGAGLGQLTSAGLRVRGEDGRVRSEHPLQTPYGVRALPDGTLVVLGRRDDKNVAIFVDTTGAEEVHPVFILTGENPIAVLPVPGDASAFWVLDHDRCGARRTARVEKWGQLDAAETLHLDNGSREDVAALASGLVFHHLDAFRRVDASGKETRAAWTPSDRIARLSPGPDAQTVWALAYDGTLALFDLGRGTVRQTIAVGATALDLASDASGLAVLSATRSASDGPAWTLTVLDVHGTVQFSVTEAGVAPAGVALSADAVAAGDAARIRIWRRKDGAEQFREG